MGSLAATPIRRGAQVLLGALFVWAALAKIGDVSSLAREVHNFRLVPLWSENLVAMMVPWVELVAGLALLTGLRARAGAWVAGAMLVAFTVGIAYAMARGLNFECGCFGTGSSTHVGWGKLGENVAMLALAALGSQRAR
jgi:putative oxidoreductase